MTHLLLVLLYLAHIVQGTSIDSTSSSCPPPNSGESTRSVWSILGRCALTLLICVWHAIHPDILGPDDYKPFYLRAPWIFLTSFFAPEVVVSYAGKEWCEDHKKVREFRVEGYEWSMTHSYFAEMGGFAYDEGEGNLRNITSLEFRQLCAKGEIANPFITVQEIKDKSKTDALGKAIFALQLFWFTLQVVVRGASGLAITLVELDTVCMSALALLYLLFWWDKPLRPECPHVFFRPQEAKVYSKADLSKAWKSEPNYLHQLIAFFVCTRKARLIADEEKPSPVGTDPRHPKPGRLGAMIEEMNPVDVQLFALYMTWIILGGLHLIAWNWKFPTEAERIIWRVASFVLAVSPLAMTIAAWLERFGISSDTITYVLGSLGVVSRLLLVGLMLASLRALPCTAYLNISWTLYVPHL